MQEEKLNKKRIYLGFGFLIVFVLAVIVVSLVNIVPKIGKVEVYVGYAPFLAEVLLNDKQVKNNSKNYLENGEYKVKVSLDGFNTLEETVIVGENTSAIFGSLVAVSQDAIKVANEHINDYEIVQSLFGEKLSKEGEAEEKEWPIIKKLPITNSLYKLGYIIEDEEITLSVSAYAAYVNLAVSELWKAAGEVDDDLVEYKIDFKKYNSDLAGVFLKGDGGVSDPIDFINNGFAGVSSYNYIDGRELNEYYYAKISTGSEESYNLVYSRLILKKMNNAWQLVSKIEPILTLYNTTEVPIEVVHLANKL